MNLPEPVVILAGGRGTRLQQDVPVTPKPLVEVGGMPILWHVIHIYAAQGCSRFIVCVGHQAEAIERSVAAASWPSGIEVTCLHTGTDTPTGGRIRRAASYLDDGSFFATYADGVADIDLAALAEHHHRQAGLATVTVVRPQLPFGVLELVDQDRVSGFREKPLSEHWINGGFFCFEPEAIKYLEDSSVLEREPFERLAADGQLYAFRHAGFWECLDTYKDALALNDLWYQDRAPWKLWSAR